MIKPRVPSYRLHKASGQAIVTIAGKDHYLGPHGSDSSHATYRRKIADWSAGAPSASKKATVADMVMAYQSFADGYYRKGGEPTSQAGKVRLGCTGLVEFAGNSPTDDFRPIDLEHLRDRWIADGLARSTINDYMTIVRDAFRWGSVRGLASPTTWHGLKAVKGVAYGRGGVERPPIGPVDQERIDSILAIVADDVAAMIRVQLLTGMRPGEASTMMAGEVDRSAAIWIYKPSVHKMSHKGKIRVIPIGPKCQAILRPWIDAAGDGLVFPPSAWRASISVGRGLSSHIALTETYRYAIRQACRTAKIKPWSANQLRHNAATEIRRLYGLEAASEILGHAMPSTTLIYAERDLEAMKRTAEAFG